jgi:hypothetical protein
MARVGHAATALIVGLMLSACTGSDGDAGTQAGDITISTGANAVDDHAGGIVGGTLGIDDHGCLYVSDSAGRSDVIWPAGFAVTAHDDQVTVLDDGETVVAQVGKPFAARGMVLTKSMFGDELPDSRRCQAADTGGATLIVQSHLPAPRVLVRA